MIEQRLLDEQLEYYQERAVEYDEWWERRGRYDRGEELNSAWRAEITRVREVFDSLPLDGDVVELASGTGYWTELLVGRGAAVTAIDGSAEMIAENRARLGERADEVDYREENLFDWVPDRHWDGLVFCFWISHVPAARLPSFFETCRRALATGGAVFFLDNQKVESVTAVDQSLPDDRSEIMIRRLNDGREFRIVKNFYEPEILVSAAEEAGIVLDVRYTETFFQYGVGNAR